MGPAELPNVTARRLPDSLRNKHTHCLTHFRGSQTLRPYLAAHHGPQARSPQARHEHTEAGGEFEKEACGGLYEAGGCSLGPHPGEARPPGPDSPRAQRGCIVVGRLRCRSQTNLGSSPSAGDVLGWAPHLPGLSFPPRRESKGAATGKPLASGPHSRTAVVIPAGRGE